VLPHATNNNQNKGTLFSGDFTRGFASHGLGTTSITVKKRDNKKKSPLKALALVIVNTALVTRVVPGQWK